MIKRFEDLSISEQFRVFHNNSLWDEDAWREAETAACGYVEDDMAQTPYIRGYVGNRGEYIEVTNLDAFVDWTLADNDSVFTISTYEYIYDRCEKLKNLRDAARVLDGFEIDIEDEYVEIVDSLKGEIENKILEYLKDDLDLVYDEGFRFDVLRDAIASGDYEIGEVWVDTDSWHAVQVDSNVA